MKRLRHHLTVVNAIRVAAISLLTLVVAGSTMSASSPDGPTKSTAAASANGKSSSKKLTKPLWSDLTPSQQEALAPLEYEWAYIHPARKKKWIDIGDKMVQMNPEERQRIQDRIRDWLKLTPEQRRIARQNFLRAKKLDPEEKTSQWQRYQQLPDDQKKKLAASAQAKPQVVNPPSETQRNKEIVAPIKSPPKSSGESTDSSQSGEQPQYWR